MKNLFQKFLWGCLVILASACSDDGDSKIPCPDGMVGFGAPDGDLCVDELEVTNDQYVLFLNENGNTCGGTQECMHFDEPGSQIVEQGASFEVVGGFGAFPVVQVTFHGADAYCVWQSKFLCPDAAWTSACGGVVARDYPYGIEYDAEACNGGDAANEAPVEAGSLPACEGGVDGLFDMSGNVYEWTDACADSDCLIRGGSFDSTSADLSCASSHTMDGPSGHRADLGLRCCAWPM